MAAWKGAIVSTVQQDHGRAISIEPNGVDEPPIIVLRRVARTLAVRWRFIVLVTALCAAVALAVGILLLATAPIYEASAAVLVSRSRLLFRIESRIETSQDPLTTSAAMGALNTRLQTIAILARSAEVESAVQQRLRDQLPADLRQPGRLVESVQVRPSGELLRVTARSHDAALAAAVANAWVEELGDRVEAVYSATGGTDTLEAEVERARAAFEAADRALNRFNIEHPVEDLSRRVQAKSDEIKALQEQRVGYLRSRATALYTSLNTVDQLIRDAETLAAQLQQPTRSQAAASGDALAVLLLRMRSYLPSPNPVAIPLAEPAVSREPRQDGTDSRLTMTVIQSGQVGSPVQFDASRFTAVADAQQDRQADLVALIDALRTRRAEMQTEFERLGQRLRDGLGSSPEALADDDPLEAALSQATADLQSLRAELAELTRQRQELTNQRDVYRTSYQALLNKAQELRVARAAGAGEGVVVAVRAVQPERPAEPRPTLFALIAAVLGLVVACLVVLQQTSTPQRWGAPSLRQAQGDA